MDNFIWKPLLQNSAKCKLHGLLYEIRQSKINNTCMCVDNFIIKKYKVVIFKSLILEVFIILLIRSSHF